MGEGRRIDEEPRGKKKQGMNSALPTNSSLAFAARSRVAALTASPAKNAPTMSGKLMKSATTPATAMIPSIRTNSASSLSRTLPKA